MWAVQDVSDMELSVLICGLFVGSSTHKSLLNFLLVFFLRTSPPKVLLHLWKLEKYVIANYLGANLS